MSSQQIADVCLLLEGTYPYVRGGVSEWVDQLIRAMPDVTFSLFFIGSQKKLYQTIPRPLPDNVLEFHEAFIMEADTEKSTHVAPRRSRLKLFLNHLSEFYHQHDPEHRVASFWKLIDHADANWNTIPFAAIASSKTAWKQLVAIYEEVAHDQSFLDFFWTVYFTHLPTFRVINVRHNVPAARVYHSVSTGYAGLLGAVVAHLRQRPCFVTEHGIYMKERIAEISQSEWIYETTPQSFTLQANLGILKNLWIQLFHFLGTLSYRSSQKIITLSQSNQKLQQEFGAPEDKLEIISNGIELSHYDPAYQQRQNASPRQSKTVGFLGRIVPIKDVTTLIRAAAIVLESCPDVQFQLAGPTDEDDDYYLKCQELVDNLGIGNRLRFIGNQEAAQFLSQIDILLLCSLSEGLPLVVLEAFAAGVPVVTTDAGACRELVCGRTPEDKALGRAGLLTPIASAPETAAAVVQLLSDQNLLTRMGEAGRKRVEEFYRLDQVVARYHELYLEMAGSQPSLSQPST